MHVLNDYWNMSRFWQSKSMIYCLLTYRLDLSRLLVNFVSSTRCQLGPTGITKMGKTTRKSGSDPKKRKRYTMEMKYQVYTWKKFKNMRLIDIRKKFKETFNMDVAEGTLAGFYAANMVKFFSKTAIDRLKVVDVRINPKQRPDILIDMEGMLARRCNAVGRTGIPYVCRIARLLALHIFHKLVASNIYDSKGQRKEQDKVLDEEMRHTVEHATLIRKYMAKSSRRTEFHKSTKQERNTPKDGLKHRCNECNRLFQDDVNLTLQVYWHTCKDRRAIARDQGQHDDEDEDEEEEEHNGNAPPGVSRGRRKRRRRR